MRKLFEPTEEDVAAVNAAVASSQAALAHIQTPAFQARAQGVAAQLHAAIEDLNRALLNAETALCERYGTRSTAIEIDEDHVLLFWKGLWIIHQDSRGAPRVSALLTMPRRLRSEAAGLLRDLHWQLQEED